MVNIKVAVRIRPLSDREVLQGDEIIVRKENKSVLVTNPKIPDRQDGDSRQRTRRFTVDFCYDSSDPQQGSTQEEVYKEIGAEVLRSMYEGYNACVLAYGHSASGKTYTIMGVQSDPGLTPRLCEGLFRELKEERPEGRICVQVVISFLEIYNEKVRDLLGSEETGGSCGNFSLRVREHPKLGPYVQGLSEHSVVDKRRLLHLLTTGNRRRSTAATESNVHSSRSHAVFTIQLKQSDGRNFETEKSSKVHLVDLAGSERARSSQSKARLQEGANINKSLATLGNVICALAESYESGNFLKEHSNSKVWQPFVPYRDSVLTWLLKDTLGGNSNTIMIATVSPASSCIGETVNTLRYAKRAKKIVNQPIVNEDPKIRTIRELRKEIARLKGLLVFFRSCGRVVDPWGSNSEEVTTVSSVPESKWQEPEGTQITIKEDETNTKEIWEEESPPKEEETEEVKRGEEEEREKKKEEREKEREEEEEEWRKKGRGEGNACKINDEKKSDVNGSVNDNFSHETQFFSDSLESFSSLFPKSRNSCDADDDDGPGHPGGGNNEHLKNQVSHPRDIRLTSRREFESHENLPKKTLPEMLHRSRPDLIKGISSRAKDNGVQLGSSHSCTDISNLSHSTSENSLNSSGSPEVQPAETKSPRNPRTHHLTSPATRGEKSARHEIPEPKKKEKKHDDAVTSRLYTTKKKPELPKKEDNEDDCGELDELKLCKRTRMKLFDLSRKLAMSRKMKKTVDIDTQTDSTTGTLRVMEKGVTTEPDLEAGSTEDWPRPERKPYVIMNQVFIPRGTPGSYVVECGEVVRVEGPPRQETATQTAEGRCRDADTSPVDFREEDCFSEDSLDQGHRNQIRNIIFTGDGQGKDNESVPDTRFNWAPNFQIRVCRDVEKTETEVQNSTKGEEPEKSTQRPVSVLKQQRINEEHVGFFLTEYCTQLLDGRKVENCSSENSIASTEGTENNSLSETSSEDFVFYENPKDLPQNKTKGTTDRELYTITENSDQSDAGDGFSPVQRRCSTEAKVQVGNPYPWPQKQEGSFAEPKEDTCRSEVKTRTTTEAPESRKTTWDNPKVPNCVISTPNNTNPEEVLPGNIRRCSGDGVDPQKQYLNLNISSSSTATPFSVDTHLFGKDSKTDRSTDAMSASADSITFVFMGPAKPKTSVLMEIIGRSLGRNNEDGSSAQKKSKSRGVQCDANLMRSVSVDTAMIALSRIARNPDTSPEMQRTSSLGKLNPDEILGRGKLPNRTGGGFGYVQNEKKWSTVGTSTTSDREEDDTTTRHKKPEVEKPKKSVWWFGETRQEAEKRWTGSGTELEDDCVPDEPGEEFERKYCPDPDVHERRVRFLKPEMDSTQRKEPDDLTVFLKEATQLLKNLNSRSPKHVFCDETDEECTPDPSRRKEDNRKCDFKASKTTEGVAKFKQEDKDTGWRWRTTTVEGQTNLTWPRRRPTPGKPPTGTRGRFSRPLPPPRPESLHSPGFPSHPQRGWSPGARTGSHGQSWNLSDLSVALSNSYLGDVETRSPSSRSSYCNSLHREYCSGSPRRMTDSISSMETNLEECCRRLEMATQQDKLREERKKKCRGDEGCYNGNEDVRDEEEDRRDTPWSPRTPREVLKRRKMGGCVGSCVCGTSGGDSCRHLWSRGCRSSFELDSFGPGSTHCSQLCMFCRKKDTEVYYSAVSLNSECTSGRCRLSSYGYCPCSPVKLNQVVLSPRAYMQKLLALRKQIVSDTKHSEVGTGGVQHGATWRNRLSLGQNF